MIKKFLKETVGLLKHVAIDKNSKIKPFIEKNQRKITFKVSNFFGNFVEKIGGSQKLAVDR